MTAPPTPSPKSTSRKSSLSGSIQGYILAIHLFEHPEFEQFVRDLARRRLAHAERLGEFGSRRQPHPLQTPQQRALVDATHFGGHDHHDS